MLVLSEWTEENAKQHLRESICKVTFTKVNGEKRVMMCTLNDSLIPKPDPSKITPRRVENPHTQPVYDIEANDWRSFRWESITSFEIQEA